MEAQNIITTEPTGFKKWAGLLVLSLALAIIVIDTTLLNVSLSTLIRELHTNIKDLQWVITAYSLTLVAFTITGGRMGDFFGRKKMFMLGAILFAIGSFIASISNNVSTLLIGESIIEGIGAALMMPATASLLVANFRGRDRAIAFGVWGGVAAAGATIGPILGGFLTTHYSWRWGFRINVGVVLILLAGSYLIKESYANLKDRAIDYIGIVLSAVGLLSVVFGIIESSSYGWFKAKQDFVLGNTTISLGWFSIVPFAIDFGLILILAFIAWEIHVEKIGKTPIVSMNLFRNKQFTAGALTTSVLTLGQTGIIFIVPVFLQSVKSLDAFHTGIALVPLSLSILAFSPIAAIYGRKIGARPMVQTGLVLNLLALIWLRQVLSPNMTIGHLVAPLALYGAGMGLIMANISNLTLSAVPVSQAGEASGVNNTLRQLGSTLGAAIIGAVLLTVLTTSMTDQVRSSNVIPPQAKDKIIQNISSPTSNVEFGGAAIPPEVPNIVKYEISEYAKTATSNGARMALLYAAGFTVLVLLTTVALPKHPIEHHEEDGPAPTASN